MMTPRVKKLREQSLAAVPSVSGERAKLITEFYKSPEANRVSPAVQHALAFKHILSHKTIVFNDGELIVGERGHGAQGHADLPRGHLPQRPGPPDPRFPAEDLVQVRRRSSGRSTRRRSSPSGAASPSATG